MDNGTTERGDRALRALGIALLFCSTLGITVLALYVQAHGWIVPLLSR